MRSFQNIIFYSYNLHFTMAYAKNYKKRYNKKSKYTKNTNWYSKKYSTLDLAKKALAGVKHLRGIINSELHITDILPIIDANVTTTPITRHLTQVAIGDTKADRTGNSYLLKSVHVKGFIDWDESASGCRLHMLVIRDNRQIADTSPTYTDFFTSASVDSFPKTDINGRFTVLAQRMFSQDDQVIQKVVNMFVPCNFHVKYNGSATTDIDQNGIYLIAITNHATNAPTLAVNTRIQFYDN